MSLFESFEAVAPCATATRASRCEQIYGSTARPDEWYQKLLAGTHGFVQKFFQGKADRERERADLFISFHIFSEAPSQYRLKGKKYSQHYGAPKRSDAPNLAPYLAGAVLTGMAVFFVVLPISFNRSYAASKQKYEAILLTFLYILFKNSS